MSKILTITVSIVIMAIIIVGLINFNLIVELWVKLLIGVLFLGALVTLVKAPFRHPVSRDS